MSVETITANDVMRASLDSRDVVLAQKATALTYTSSGLQQVSQGFFSNYSYTSKETTKSLLTLYSMLSGGARDAWRQVVAGPNVITAAPAPASPLGLKFDEKLIAFTTLFEANDDAGDAFYSYILTLANTATATSFSYDAIQFLSVRPKLRQARREIAIHFLGIDENTGVDAELKSERKRLHAFSLGTQASCNFIDQVTINVTGLIANCTLQAALITGGSRALPYLMKVIDNPAALNTTEWQRLFTLT